MWITRVIEHGQHGVDARADAVRERLFYFFFIFMFK
jgi:hypothetical protein